MGTVDYSPIVMQPACEAALENSNMVSTRHPYPIPNHGANKEKGKNHQEHVQLIHQQNATKM
jgi:hypothetical protein